MTRKIFRNIIIICVAAFIMAALSVALCANYLLNYKPVPTEKDVATFIVTDDNGETQVVHTTQVEGSYNFLVLGHDRAALLTDVIMLINYNMIDSKVTITQFPRDTYVSGDIPTNKINAVFGSYYNQEIANGGDYEEARLKATRRLADTLEGVFGINIYKCAIMDLDGFRQIVDALGGVEVDVPTDMQYVDEAQNLYINLHAGLQTLNGDQAEQFVRYRKSYLQADIGRENAQKIFMSALIKKLKESVSISNTGKLTSIANALIDNTTTDLTVSDLVFFGKGWIGDVQLSDMRMFTAPGNGVEAYYILQKNVLLDIIKNNYNTTDVSEAVLVQNFDKNNFFTEVNYQPFYQSYIRTEEPTIGYDFSVQEIIDDSIYIPQY